MGIDRRMAVALAREMAAFVPDVIRLFRDVLRDDRVPRRVKVQVGAAVAYLLMPIDLVPDVIAGFGQLDDLAVVGWAVQRLVRGAGEPVIRAHWQGTERGLEILLQAADIGLHPRKLLRALATGGFTPAKPRVIEGELVD